MVVTVVMVIFNMIKALIERRWLIVGSFAGLGLAGVSMFFNWNVGYWSGMTVLGSIMFGAAYVALDLEFMFLFRELMIGIDNWFLKIASCLCCALLFVLTLWTGFTYFAAQDEQYKNDLNKRQISRLEDRVEERKMQIKRWQDNADGTKKYNILYDQTLEEKLAKLDELESQLIKLEKATPPPFLIVFTKYESYFERFLGLSSDDFQLLIRVVFGFAIASSSVLCIAVAGVGAKNLNSGGPSNNQEQAKRSFFSFRRKLSAPEELDKGKSESTSYILPPSVNIERYEEIKSKVLSGAVRCSHRAIKECGVGTNTATSILKRMHAAGYIELTGRGYKIVDEYKQVNLAPVLQLVN